VATKLCCGKPMIVIEASTGALKQGDFDHNGKAKKFPDPPIRLYKCPICGDLIGEDTRIPDGR